MKILVPGARGFIVPAGPCGAPPRPQVVAADQAALGRDLPEGVDAIQGDVTRPEEWRAAFEGVECVVHCAAIHLPDEIAEGLSARSK